MQTTDFLAKLVSFPTVSAATNRPLIDYVAGYLDSVGFECEIIPDATGSKASLFATIGPRSTTGILLSGHVDVVPANAGEWSTNPFILTKIDERLIGRGTADMKGFVASVLAFAGRIDAATLDKPLHIALSYDEEIGCVGVRPMLDLLAARGFKADLCIIGEPTSMQIMRGHKGKVSARATCRGMAGHSASAPNYMNAIHLACDFVASLRAEQARLVTRGHQDTDYDVPHTTLHVGRIAGGTALNIVPEQATVDFEIRNVPGDDPDAILKPLLTEAERISAAARRSYPRAEIEIEVLNAYPGLDVAPDARAVGLARQFAGETASGKVSFGTEAGLFAAKLAVPAVILGPGSMQQGHTVGEYIAVEQLSLCDRMLDRLLTYIGHP